VKRWALALALLVASAARAAPSCHSISVTTLAFGNYDVYATTPLDTAGTILYSCPPPALPTVSISAGNGGSYSPRLMQLTGGTETLQYNVYVDAARTTVWGATPISVAQGNVQTVPFYGRIFAQQDVSVGSYTDTLVVTFNF
jgi:spore coat protein U-like protein